MGSTRSVVTFPHLFTLSGHPDKLPADEYEALLEEELRQPLRFAAHRRAATYLTVRGEGGKAGRTVLRLINLTDLDAALGQDRSTGT